VAGTWRDLTESVNSMAGNLTNQVRNIAGVTTAVAKGDPSTKSPSDARGEILELKSTINTMVDQLNSFAAEVTRVAREVGTEGQARRSGAGEGCRRRVEGSHRFRELMAGNRRTSSKHRGRDTAVARAIFHEDHGRRARRNFGAKNTINTMVDQLNSFRIRKLLVWPRSRTDGKLGGQAQVRASRSVWKDLTGLGEPMAGT